MKNFNYIILIVFVILMLLGSGVLFLGGPENKWVRENWTPFHCVDAIKGATLCIVGWIGIFSELIILNINRKE